MSLRDLTYSQSSLSDFVECPRCFQLRYVDQVAWPAVQAEPLLEHERHLDRGARFHRLVERHQLGLPHEVLTASIDDPELLAWWRAYLDYRAFHDAPGERYVEYVLSADVDGVRLLAKYDALRVEVGERVVIVDWKTYSHSPGRERLLNHVQTHVYPYVLMSSGRFPWLEPEMLTMVYWIAGDPTSPVEVTYHSLAYERDRRFLAGLLERVMRYESEPVWPLTADERACRFCHYRSLCGRGVTPGKVEEDSGMSLFDFDVVGGGDWVVGFDSVADVGF